MNNKLVKIICSIFGILIGIIILISIFSTKKTNWIERFGIDNKHPFGFYILYQELGNITNAKSIHEVKDLKELEKLNPKTDVIFYLDENKKSNDIVIDAINELNNKPLTLFYAYAYYQVGQDNNKLIDQKAKAKINGKEVLIKQNRHTDDANYVKYKKQLNSIGTVQIKDSVFTNYYIEQNNKMKEYTHVQPILFSNFYLLQKDGFAYAKEVFKPFAGKNIYWINPNTNYQNYDNEGSALSFILSQRELKTAWYILLIALFLYMIFKSKREQKIIPIVEPEKNLSLEFANAIASMYYESGQPSDIIKKQIDYFYYTLRKQYHISTEDVTDKQFIYVLAQKAQITEEESIQIINELQMLYNNKKAIIKDVNRTYQIIDYYKKKAHII